MTNITTLPLIEPAPIMDQFVTTLARADRLGPNYRLTFAAEQVLVETDGQDNYNVVVAKLIMSVDAARALVATLERQLETATRSPNITIVPMRRQ